MAPRDAADSWGPLEGVLREGVEATSPVERKVDITRAGIKVPSRAKKIGTKAKAMLHNMDQGEKNWDST